jgi:TrmH family RNA methyltransferase
MLTAHKIKILQSLDKKKFRQKYNLFLVEGNKTIKEIPTSEYIIREIYSVNPSELSLGELTATEISPAELKKISFLQHPKDSVAVCELKEEIVEKEPAVQLILDGIQDPGNLGTIIRLADWFGISQIICSEDTVDFYNPKVIQASMGSFLRVNIVYKDLENYLADDNQPLIGTDMDGTSFYDYEFPEQFNLVLGNEGNGIRPEIENLLTDKITIPRFGKSKATESLNVAMSAGIILGQIFNKK